MNKADLARVLGACSLGALAMTVFSLATSGGSASAAPLPERVVVSVAAGILYVAVLAPLALRLHCPWPRRLAKVFVTLYVTGTLTDLVEAYFFTTLLSPSTLIAALIFEAVPALVIALIVIALLHRPSTEVRPPSIFWHHRSPFAWTWRLLLVGALYVPIYFGFAALVAPLEHPFYNDPAFIAQLHTQVPPDSVAIPLEAGRGVLFALALLPALSVMRGRSWSTLVYLTLIGVVIEAWVPLLGRTAWPLAMRLGNVAELTGDALGRAAAAIALLGVPAVLAEHPRPSLGAGSELGM